MTNVVSTSLERHEPNENELSGPAKIHSAASQITAGIQELPARIPSHEQMHLNDRVLPAPSHLHSASRENDGKRAYGVPSDVSDVRVPAWHEALVPFINRAIR